MPHTFMTRRQLMKLAGIAVGTVSIGASWRLRKRSYAIAPNGMPVALPLSAGPEVEALFGPLTEGAAVGPFQIEKIYDLHMGAIPVVLRAPDGSQFHVDVLRRGAQLGIGQSASLSVFLANRGDGGHPTHEAHGLGAMALADALAAREKAGARPPQGLLSFEERSVRHAGRQLSILA